MKNNSIIVDKDQIIYFSEKTTFKNVIEKLSEPLISKKLVKQEYPNYVIKREKSFPTGLPTQPIGVSIPHTDAKWTNHNAIAIGILKNPISQTIMSTEDTPVKVSIVFMLALDQSNKQLNILSKLMNVFQNKDILIKIQDSTKQQIQQIIKKVIMEE